LIFVEESLAAGGGIRYLYFIGCESSKESK